MPQAWINKARSLIKTGPESIKKVLKLPFARATRVVLTIHYFHPARPSNCRSMNYGGRKRKTQLRACSDRALCGIARRLQQCGPASSHGGRTLHRERSDAEASDGV